MGQPVVYFEINSPAAVELGKFYAEAFGWSLDASDPSGYVDVRTERAACSLPCLPARRLSTWPSTRPAPT